MSLKENVRLESEAYELRKELLAIADAYHFRSDQYTGLSIEADAVTSQAAHALGKENPGVLIKPCDTPSETHPVPDELQERLNTFYEKCKARIDAQS